MGGDEARRFRRLVGAELFKLRRRPMSWVVAVVLAIVCAALPFLYLAAVELSRRDGEEVTAGVAEIEARLGFPDAFQGALEATLSYGLPLIIILTAAAFGGEYAWGTLRLVLSRGQGRREYVLAKLTGLAVWWALLLAAGLGAALVSFTLVAAIEGQAGLLSSEVADLATFAARAAAAFLGGLAYVALTASIAVQSRSTAVAVAVGLVAFFGDRLLFGALAATGVGPLEWLARIGLNHNLRSLIGGSDGGNSLPLAGTFLAFYATLAVSGAIKKLRAQDITVAGIG